MKQTRHYFFIAFLFVAALSFSGCAILSLPLQAIGLVFKLTAAAFKLAEAMPKPPPGVFF